MKLLLLLSLFFTYDAYSKKLSQKGFEKWKKSYAKRAMKRGISKKYSLSILGPLKLDMKVVERDRKQVLKSKTVNYHSFMKRWLREDNQRIATAKKMLMKHHDLLTKIEKKYGVDKEVIISLWGVETLFGQITGDYNVIRSLATLAYEGRRRKFYEIQLNAALRLIRAGHVTFDDFKGSWAGATGQCQFMPSNINGYAQDFNGDGKKDIWNTHADIFASIAYLLKRAGWQKGKSIGSLAKQTRDLRINFDRYRSQHQYNKLGIRNLDGSKINTRKWRKRKAATIPLKDSPLILRGSNYKPLLRWNNSSLFAAFNIILVESLKEMKFQRLSSK